MNVDSIAKWYFFGSILLLTSSWISAFVPSGSSRIHNSYCNDPRNQANVFSRSSTTTRTRRNNIQRNHRHYQQQQQQQQKQRRHGNSLESLSLASSSSPVIDVAFQSNENNDVPTAPIGTVVFLVPSDGSGAKTPTKFGSNAPIKYPTISETTSHFANKVDWFSDGRIQAVTYTPFQVDSTLDVHDQVVKDADCVIAYYLTDPQDLRIVSKLFQQRKKTRSRRRGYEKCHFAIQCPDFYKQEAFPLLGKEKLTPMVGRYDSNNPFLLTQLLPWSKMASWKRLQEQMISLFDRWTSDDFTVAILLYFQLCTPKQIQIPWVQYSIDATWEKGPIQNAMEFVNMVTKCGPCIIKCLGDTKCRTCLDALTKVDTRDQVASYRTIVSYESDLLRDFSLCILQKHNIFGCNANIPQLPYVPPITEFRGKQLTQEMARQLLIAHLDDDDAPRIGKRLDVSWKVACGANVAYDQFPCQNQLFYKAGTGNDLWYDPVFRVETIDGYNVWAKRHYRVRDGRVAGTFRFSVLDNGVTSNEYWTIAGVAEDLSWIVFHYAGAAAAVGQRYIGGLICTPTGELPADDVLNQDVWKVLEKTGIKPWELFVVDNDPTSRGAREAGPPPLNYFREQVFRAKAVKKNAQIIK